MASETEIGGMSLLNGNYFSHTDQADLYRFIFPIIKLDNV